MSDRYERDPDTPDRKYFHIMLNMDDDDLDPYQYRLMGHYSRWKRTAESTQQTADATGMAKGKVSEVRSWLEQHGYLIINRAVEPFIVTLTDRWTQNIARYQRSPDEHPSDPRSHGEHDVHGVNTVRKGQRSPGEPLEEHKEKEEEGKEQPSDFSHLKHAKDIYEVPVVEIAIRDHHLPELMAGGLAKNYGPGPTAKAIQIWVWGRETLDVRNPDYPKTVGWLRAYLSDQLPEPSWYQPEVVHD